MSDIDSLRGKRLLSWGFAAWTVANICAMYLFPGKETIPFHFVWIGISIVYGFTAWSRTTMLAWLVFVAATTGYTLVHHVQSGVIGWEETTEVPLMTAVFLVMVWHVNRRHRALAEVALLAERERHRAEVQQLLVRLASHELRTPITVARGYTELVRSAAKGNGFHEDTTIVLEELDKLARMIQRLVTLMQIDGTRGRIRMDVDCEISRIVHRWEPAADREWVIRSHVGEMPINPERLEAALDSL